MPGTDEIVAMVVVASFAAGLNVYATVATLGLLAHTNVVQFPHALHLLSSWPVIIAATVLFVVEFFADKIPAFDVVWNALQTFVRVPVAALISYGATAQMSTEARLVAALAGGAIALLTHGSKTAIRAGILPSPEPVSNIALSTAEDALAIGLTWFATAHPYIAAAIAICVLALLILLVRFTIRGLRRLYRRWRGSPAEESDVSAIRLPTPGAPAPAARSADSSEKLAQLSECERQGEQAYDQMYEEHSFSGAMACYSEAKESFYEAIRRAEELGMREKADALRARLEHIKAVYRKQFTA